MSEKKFKVERRTKDEIDSTRMFDTKKEATEYAEQVMQTPWGYIYDLGFHVVECDTPATPTGQWQKCGEDCDCKDECKQLVADTPQIMQELSNRDKWQKEAEELSWKEFPMNHLTPKGENETIIENRGIYVLGFIKARELSYTEHAAHLAQLQGEIERRTNNIAKHLSEYGVLLPEGCLDKINEEMQVIRSITQTKMKGE